MSSLCFDYGLQTIRERMDGGIYEFNIEFFYDFADSFLELIKVSDFHFIYFSIDNSPKILDDIEIGWIRQPVIHPAQRIGIEPIHWNFLNVQSAQHKSPTPQKIGFFILFSRTMKIYFEILLLSCSILNYLSKNNMFFVKFNLDH